MALLSSACAPTAPARPVIWGSADASLRIAENAATVQVLAPGGCYGAFGDIEGAIPTGAFALPGTYTQLMGAYPGSVQYAAEYDGTTIGSTMMLSISVPALQQTIGPFRLTAGVSSAWSPCLYP